MDIKDIENLLPSDIKDNLEVKTFKKYAMSGELLTEWKRDADGKWQLVHINDTILQALHRSIRVERKDGEPTDK